MQPIVLLGRLMIKSDDSVLLTLFCHIVIPFSVVGSAVWLSFAVPYRVWLGELGRARGTVVRDCVLPSYGQPLIAR